MNRILLVWCPDWPVVAASLVDGLPVDAPVAVLAANRVLACSPAARGQGVRRGLSRREAQARCPHILVVADDPGRDARAFEPVLAALEAVVTGVEVVRPGAAALAASGPARYFGSEAAAAEQIVEHLSVTCGVQAQVGVADGGFAAELAARAGHIVPPGTTTEFLSEQEISTLNRPELVDLLRRLGIRSLGDFAALPPADVLARFGFDAALAHRLAGGQDERPLAPRRPPPDLEVAQDFDEPLLRVDTAAFAARQLAARLHDLLANHGVGATRLGIEASTEHGEHLRRTWRHDGLLSVAAIAERVRWQLDGWLTAGPSAAPTGGITRLCLVPEGIVDSGGFQLGLWGEHGEQEERAHRALARLQGLLGPQGVLCPVLGGGRDPKEQIRMVPWGDDRVATRSAEPPWPGRLPDPLPATVLTAPIPAAVLDAAGSPVGVSARLVLTGEPATLTRAGSRPVSITGWAGPWPVDERWWAPAEASRRVRFQVQLADGQALLLSLAAGAWTVAAIYD